MAEAWVPTGMLFVRKAHGSHNPDEAVELTDLDMAVALLSSRPRDQAGWPGSGAAPVMDVAGRARQPGEHCAASGGSKSRLAAVVFSFHLIFILGIAREVWISGDDSVPIDFMAFWAAAKIAFTGNAERAFDHQPWSPSSPSLGRARMNGSIHRCAISS